AAKQFCRYNHCMILPVDHLRELVKKAHSAGETYASMGARCSVHASQLLRFANGQDLNSSTVERIARAFGIMPKNAASQRTVIALARMLAESRIDPSDVDAFLKKNDKAGK